MTRTGAPGGRRRARSRPRTGSALRAAASSADSGRWARAAASSVRLTARILSRMVMASLVRRGGGDAAEVGAGSGAADFLPPVKHQSGGAVQHGRLGARPLVREPRELERAGLEQLEREGGG